MTTTVIVETHDWPAEVRSFPLKTREPVKGGEWGPPKIVPPKSKERFVVHDGQDLLVKELPKDGA